MPSTERSREPLSVHDILPRVSSFLIFISLEIGSIIIGVLSIIYCPWHIYILITRKHSGSKNIEFIGFWRALMIISDLALGVLGIVLIKAVSKKDLDLAKMWILAALQNGIMLLIFEYVACPLHYENPMSKQVFKQWPYTFYYCTIPLVFLYCMYVVNSYITSTPKDSEPCPIPMTEEVQQ